MMQTKLSNALKDAVLFFTAIAILLYIPISCARAPQAEQTLRIGLEAEPVTLDPHLNAESATWSVLGNIFEGLVGFDRNMGIVPQLAVSWENPDDTTWLFHLRRGATFHNGQIMKASDVIYSLKRAKYKMQSKVSGAIALAEGFEAAGDYTVKITTDKPDPILLNKLTSIYIVPRTYYETSSDSMAAQHPVGTGPYKLDRWLQKQQVTLVRNEYYYGKRPNIDKVIFIEVASRDMRAQSLLTGKVDLIRSMPAEYFEKLKDHTEFRMITSPGLMISYLGLDMSGKCRPFLDAKVRKAIYLGINIDGIINAIVGGYASPANQLAPQGIFGYNPGLIRPAYNPVQALALMEASRYPKGFAVTLDIPENALSVGEAIRADLEKIGIKITLVAAPWRQFYKKITGGQTAFYLVGWTCTNGDASDIFNACLHSPVAGREYGGANIGRYSDSRLDSLIEISNQLLAVSERQDCLQLIMSLAMDDLPLIPLYMQNNFYGARKGILWQPRLDERIYVSEIELAGKE
jgi:peptide/nickel transport system substrate-binding protein